MIIIIIIITVEKQRTNDIVNWLFELYKSMYNWSAHKPKRAGENDADRTISHDARLLNGSYIFFSYLFFVIRR